MLPTSHLPTFTLPRNIPHLSFFHIHAPSTRYRPLIFPHLRSLETFLTSHFPTFTLPRLVTHLSFSHIYAPSTRYPPRIFPHLHALDTLPSSQFAIWHLEKRSTDKLRILIFHTPLHLSKIELHFLLHYRCMNHLLPQLLTLRPPRAYIALSMGMY